MVELLLSNGPALAYSAIIAVLVLTGMGLPIPEEVPVITAGVLSSTGQLDPTLAFIACLIGAIAGDCVMYWIGFHFGRNFLRERHWWARVVSPEREAMIERQIQTHGFKVFFAARFMVGLRSPVYFSAGILHMPFRRFFLIDIFAATAVVGTFFGLSYLFGEPITRWVKGFEYGLTAVGVIATAVVGIFFWRKHRRKVKKELAAGLEATTPREAEEAGQGAPSSGTPSSGTPSSGTTSEGKKDASDRNEVEGDVVDA